MATVATTKSTPATKVAVAEELTPTTVKARLARSPGIRPQQSAMNQNWEVILTRGSVAAMGDGKPWILEEILSPHFLEEKQSQWDGREGTAVFRRGDRVTVRTETMLVDLVVTHVDHPRVHTELYQGNPHQFGEVDLAKADWSGIDARELSSGKWVLERDHKQFGPEFDEEIKAKRWLAARRMGIPIDGNG